MTVATERHSITFYLITFYFVLAPLEDILSTEFGTILKYLAGAISMFWLFDITKQNYKILLNRFLIIPLYLVILSWMSVIWSYSISTTISRNVAYTLLPFLYLVMTNYKYTEREIEILDYAILMGGALAAIHGLFYTFTNLGLGARVVITERSDPNGFVGRVFLSFFVSYKYMLVANRKQRFLFLLAFALLLFSILSTGSRGGVVALVVAGLVWLKGIGKLTWKSRFLIVVALLGTTVLVFNILPSTLTDRILGIDSYTVDFQGSYSRTAIWKTFITTIFPIDPIFGFGSGNTELLMQMYHGRPQGMHNTYLNIVLEYGVFGLPIFLLFLFYIYKDLKKYDLVIEIGLLFAVMVVVFFLDAYAKKYLWATLTYLVIIISHQRSRQLAALVF